MTAEAPRKLIDRARQYLHPAQPPIGRQTDYTRDDLINDLAQSLERSEQSLQQAIKLLRDVAEEDERPYDLNEIVRFLTQHGPDG